MPIGSTVGPIEHVGRDGLGPRRRVRQGQNDGTLHPGGHGPHHLLGEQAGLARHPDQGVGLHPGDHIEQGARAQPARSHFVGGAQVAPLERQQGFHAGHLVVQQTVTVDQPAAGDGFGLGQPLSHQEPDQLVGHAGTGRTGTDDDHPKLVGRLPAQTESGLHRGGDDRCRALDVVVERTDPIPVAIEQPAGVALGEVLPLDDGVGQSVGHRVDEGVDQLVVVVAPHAVAPPSEVERIGKQDLVVGADVEQDGQGSAGIDPAHRAVEGQLADGDAHATGPEVAQSEDALAIADHDDGDVIVIGSAGGARRAGGGTPRRWPDGVVEQLGHAVPVGPRQVEALFLTVDPRPLLTGQADRRGVDDRQHLGQVAGDEGVEQYRVPTLEKPQENVATKIGALGVVLDPGPLQLPVEGLDDRRQQPVEPVAIPLGRREGGSLVDVAVSKSGPSGRFVDGIAHRPSLPSAVEPVNPADAGRPAA